MRSTRTPVDLTTPVFSGTTSKNDGRRTASAIVVTCKGRLEHLRQAVACLLRQQCSHEFRVIVVDYGDPDESFEWVVKMAHPQLYALRVTDDNEFFNLSRARNCGARSTDADILGFVDADALANERWLTAAVEPVLTGMAVASVPDWKSTASGICMVRASTFHQVRGFDESFAGWGGEDLDFINRVALVGTVDRFDSRLLTVIPHDDALRVQFYEEKNARRSNVTNCSRAEQPSRSVNPAGYGLARVECFPAADSRFGDGCSR